jgi:CMP/dCMP kinase
MKSTSSRLIIAVDGHSSCGKSTFAKAIADKLGYLYIDSGAMYRAVTLFCMETHLIMDEKVDHENLLKALPFISIEFHPGPAGKQETWMNGRNVEEAIRQPAISEKVSIISKIREVRQQMVKLQRYLGRNKGIVMDGRDIGTVVFPEAELKIFMTASLEVRAERRYKELVEKGISIDKEEVKENLATRDRIDSSREESPLRQAQDAIVLDNSLISVEDQMIWLEKLLDS